MKTKLLIFIVSIWVFLPLMRLGAIHITEWWAAPLAVSSLVLQIAVVWWCLPDGDVPTGLYNPPESK